MMRLTDLPLVVFLLALVLLWLSARAGALLGRHDPRGPAIREDMGVVLGATLTLLGLLIGFSFSMATNRYDARKSCEEVEANTIGTEYLRAQLLPPAAATQVRALLRDYTAERILFYETRDAGGLAQINTRTNELESGLWSAVRDAAAGSPTPITTLVVSGMNDVINSEGYTQAAWWNRIPRAAWTLLVMIALLGNFILGYTSHHLTSRAVLLSVLPLVVAVALFLIADIDSPRGGVIQVSPHNLIALAPTLK